jgi:hypothetical protein
MPVTHSSFTVASTVDAASCLNPAVFQSPRLLIYFIPIVRKIRAIWYAWKKVEIYCNPDNFLKLAAGQTIKELCGEAAGFPAQLVLVARRIQEFTLQKLELLKSFCTFKDVLFHIYPQRIKRPKLPLNATKMQRIGAYLNQNPFLNRIREIAHAAFMLLKELFKLCMSFMDAIDAFYLDSKSDAIREVFVHLSDIASNIEAYGPVIDKVLGVLAPSTNSLSILGELRRKAAETAIKIGEFVHNGVNGEGGVLSDIGNSAADTIGINSFCGVQ